MHKHHIHGKVITICFREGVFSVQNGCVDCGDNLEGRMIRVVRMVSLEQYV